MLVVALKKAGECTGEVWLLCCFLLAAILGELSRLMRAVSLAKELSVAFTSHWPPTSLASVSSAWFS